MLGCHARWVAVEVDTAGVFVSLHLPHKGFDFDEFCACLQSLTDFLDTVETRCVYIGMDANTRVSSIVDHVHVGEAVDKFRYDTKDRERAPVLHDVLCRYGLRLINTFCDLDEAPCFTRYDWNGTHGTQIDFIAVPVGRQCDGAGVDTDMVFSTDHRFVWTKVSCRSDMKRRSQRRSMRNWSPGASWYDEACSFAWDWHDWETFTTHWCEFAWHNALRKPKSRDEVLLEMLKQHRHASILEKRVLNKLIWRRRRSLKRLKYKQEVRMAVGKGAFPRSAPKHISINWAKLSNGRDPADVMREYYCRLYALDEAAEVTELTCKQHWIETWRSLCTGLQSYQVTVARLRAAIKKLRNSKGSPDGCVAEMYKHLPDAALEGLAEYFTALLTAVSSPDAWTVVCATLIPKVVGACSLDKFRAIACLPVARKLLGYIWLQMLPALRYHTLQCGFVPKSQAANGVYILKRTAELSKEWKKPLFLAQLDLTKAFDRELHSAVVKALRLQGVSLQCLAIICNVFLKSKAATTLGHVTAEVVDMLQGLRRAHQSHL